MTYPTSTEYTYAWSQLTAAQRNILECMYDGSIPYQAIADMLRRSKADEPEKKEGKP